MGQTATQENITYLPFSRIPHDPKKHGYAIFDMHFSGIPRWDRKLGPDERICFFTGEIIKVDPNLTYEDVTADLEDFDEEEFWANCDEEPTRYNLNLQMFEPLKTCLVPVL